VSATRTESWIDANQRHLAAALAGVRAALARHAGPRAAGADGPLADAGALDEEPGAAGGTTSPPPALETLVATFGLSRFERAVLLLCAGHELDARFSALCAAAQGDPARAHPTFGLALAVFPEAHWSALTPEAPLRRWRLVDVGPGGPLTQGPLRIDERVLHYLAGVSHLDERLAGMLEPLEPGGDLAPSQRALAGRIAEAWSRGGPAGPGLPLIQLCGPDASAKAAVIAEACATLQLAPSRLAAAFVPAGAADLDAFVRLWTREAALERRALVVDADEADLADAAREAAIVRLVERSAAPLILTGRDRRPAIRRHTVTLDVARPSATEQGALWRAVLGDADAVVNGQLDRLVGQFDLGVAAIRSAAAEAGARLDGGDPGQRLWDACVSQARPRVDDLAQRIETTAGWDDLVLPEAQRQILRDIAAAARQRHRVYTDWGFAARGARGLGLHALFAGPSGTGKTMAAEVLARALRLDLYRIDLSQVVSKYIGETEKNLRRVFDAAEGGGALLLFDEADALFGKRSEVKDSHDRYANIEVSYLLQRMEAYRGLAILTTNMKDALDPAFLRRLRFVVQFPFPDAAHRAEIWRRAFPAATPTEGLRPDRLARLNVAGGNIRNIAVQAAFLAADLGEPVRMAHLLRAARAECAKLDRPLSDAEIGAWT
jgi:hypothetical protein